MYLAEQSLNFRIFKLKIKCMIFGESQGKDGPFLTFMLVLETVVLLVFALKYLMFIYMVKKKCMLSLIQGT